MYSSYRNTLACSKEFYVNSQDSFLLLVHKSNFYFILFNAKMYSRYPAVLFLFYFYFIFSFEAALENTVLSDKSYKKKYAQTLANFFFFSCVRCLISCVHVFMSSWQFSVYLSIWGFFSVCRLLLLASASTCLPPLFRHFSFPHLRTSFLILYLLLHEELIRVAFIFLIF